MHSHQASPPATARRGSDLSDRWLVSLLLAAIALLTAFFSLQSVLPASWRTPGSPPLYVLGLAGGALLLVSMGFVTVKRTGRRLGPAAPRIWFIAHVVAALPGMVLVAVHSAGSLTNPPALLFLTLIALTVLGVWARLRGSGSLSAVFATRHANFRGADPVLRARLEALIARKSSLLQQIAPGAGEATFSPALAHWMRHPWRCLAYARLVRQEAGLIGLRRAMNPAQAHWRRLHILLGALFVAGLAAHVFTVTFMAEYTAQGREITWPHINLW